MNFAGTIHAYACDIIWFCLAVTQLGPLFIVLVIFLRCPSTIVIIELSMCILQTMVSWPGKFLEVQIDRQLKKKVLVRYWLPVNSRKYSVDTYCGIILLRWWKVSSNITPDWSENFNSMCLSWMSMFMHSVRGHVVRILGAVSLSWIHGAAMLFKSNLLFTKIIENNKSKITVNTFSLST